MSVNRCVFVCVLCWQLLPITDEQEFDAVTTPLVCYCIVWSLQKTNDGQNRSQNTGGSFMWKTLASLCSGRKRWWVFSFYLTTCQTCQMQKQKQTHTHTTHARHMRVRKVEIWWTKMDGLIFHSSFVLWTFYTVVVNHHTSIFLCVVLCLSYLPVCFFLSEVESQHLMDRVKSESIRGTALRCFGDKAREVRRWWCGHVQRRYRKYGGRRMQRMDIWYEGRGWCKGRGCREEGVMEEYDFLWGLLKGKMRNVRRDMDILHHGFFFSSPWGIYIRFHINSLLLVLRTDW